MALFKRFYFMRLQTEKTKHWRIIGAYFWKKPSEIINEVIEDIGVQAIEVIEFKRI